MGTLFSQKGWFKSRKNNDSDENQRKNRIQAGIRIAIALAIKAYLQVLFTVGAYISGRSWVDKHIKMCYNMLDEVNSDYDKTTQSQWYK